MTDEHVILLVGFMGVGKTTIAKALASELDIPFVDLDQVVSNSAGQSVAEIFESDGEPQFRKLESQALRKLEAPAVVATGGGAFAQASNQSWMLEHGLVLGAMSDFETCWRRIKDSGRPLARDKAKCHALFDTRKEFYLRAHGFLTAATVEQKLEQAISCSRTYGLMPQPCRQRSTIVGAGGGYAVSLCQDVEVAASLIAKSLAADTTKVVIVSDSNVAPLHGDAMVAALSNAGLQTSIVQLQAGEENKTLEHFADLQSKLIAEGIDRKGAIVALGGGVVGDMAGFVAATMMRGVPVVQVPTTLLAMIDAAIGGKTGVNIPEGKNLVGAFWQPSAVAIVLSFLETLDNRHLNAAYGELLKYGLLVGGELYRDIIDLDLSDLDALGPIILRCAKYKSWSVTADSQEQADTRVLLNLGHTVGHALEKAHGFGKLLHGEAVGLGLLAALKISETTFGCPRSVREQVGNALKAHGLESNLDMWIGADTLRHVGVDKKRIGANIKFVGLRDKGETELALLSSQDIAEMLG